MTFLATHLWQSTLLVGVAALLVRLLRANHARMRYFIWLAASVKFLVPFAALVALGRQLAWWTPQPLTGSALAVAETIAAPLTIFNSPEFVAMEMTASTVAAQSAAAWNVHPLFAAIWIAGVLLVVGVWCVRWRRVTTILKAATPVTCGRELDILRRVERRSGARGLSLLASDSPLEPGVVGCANPVILWPSNISHRMTDDQIEAILLHEVAHVKRRDNLLALLHMSVQALFWFHPLVWWIGARLVDERERACDEDVVQRGADPHQYAESILRTCEYAVESPLVCVAGVTGADLKRRVTAIVGAHRAARPGIAKLALLTAIGVLVAVGPMAAGALTRGELRIPVVRKARMSVAASNMWSHAQAPTGQVQVTTLQGGPAPVTAAAPADPSRTFEVASVKRNSSGEASMRIGIQPGGRYTATNVPLSQLITSAYQLQRFQLVGGPDWMRNDRFDITAKAEGDVAPTPMGTAGPIQMMMRNLLADRFKLAVHEEEREMPVYALVLARDDKRLGAGLQPSTIDCQAMIRDAAAAARGGARPSPGQRPFCGMQMGNGTLKGAGFLISQFPGVLAPIVQRYVVDRTGLTGSYDINLTFAPEQRGGDAPGGIAGAQPAPDIAGASIFTALQEQLGLKLEAQRGPVKVLVIDSVQQPTED